MSDAMLDAVIVGGGLALANGLHAQGRADGTLLRLNARDQKPEAIETDALQGAIRLKQELSALCPSPCSRSMASTPRCSEKARSMDRLR